MAFDETDAHALEMAAKHNIPHMPHRTDAEQQVFKFIINQTSDEIAVGPAAILARAMEAAERFFNYGATTTVWLDIQGDFIPEWVVHAIEKCKSMAIGIVVTHKGVSSHDQDVDGFFPALRDALNAAARSGKIWNPTTNNLVFSRVKK